MKSDDEEANERAKRVGEGKARRADYIFNLFPPFPPPPLKPPFPLFSAILLFLSSSSLINCWVALSFTAGPAPPPLDFDEPKTDDGLADLKTFDAGAARLRGLEKPSLTGAGAGAAVEGVVVEEDEASVFEGEETTAGLGAPNEKESLTSGSRTSPSSTEGPAAAEGSAEEEEEAARAIWSARSLRWRCSSSMSWRSFLLMASCKRQKGKGISERLRQRRGEGRETRETSN